MNLYLKFHKQVKASLNRYTEEIKCLKDKSLFNSKSFLPAELSIPATISYWISEEFDLGEEKERICSTLSLGNLYGISYIRSATNKNLERFSGWLLFKAMREYQKLFSSNSEFWSYTEGYMNEMIEYLNFYFKKSKIKLEKGAIKISGNRYSLQKCVGCAICLLNKEITLLPQIEEMIDHFNTALSLRNAAREWEYDYQNNHLTLPLIRLSLLKREIKKESIEDILFLEGIIEETLNHSVYYLNLSLEIAQRLKLNIFVTFLEHTSLQIMQTLKNLESIRLGK